MENHTKTNAATQIAVVIGQTIRDLKEIPSGHLYAILMGSLNLDEYQRIISALKKTGLVSESNHLLTWVGPAKEAN